MALIWAEAGHRADAKLQEFLAGDDVLLDRELFLFDVRATKAHARGLGRIGILTADEALAMTRELDALAAEFSAGTFVLDARFEDGHSAIEAYLTEKLGETGKRVHTGRSRNDQVQVALRLYLQDRLHEVAASSAVIADAMLARAERDGSLPMPGYTHLQRAVPSSVGLWLGAFAEAFIDDAAFAASTRDWLASCPLGTGAGYGVNLPLDRDGVARELDLARVQWNPMYVQNSRGKFELAALGALAQALLDVRRFAWDLSLFTSAEFAFVALPAAYVTGSSLMPNKKNPDVVELLRAAAASVIGAQVEIASALSLPSGYHRDLQVTKGPLLRAMRQGLGALSLVARLVKDMELQPERMRAAITREMFATDRATEMARTGVPFRDAYLAVAKDLGGGAGPSIEASLAGRVSAGATAALRLAEMRARLDAEKAKLGAALPSHEENSQGAESRSSGRRRD
jgi:argininosuccinate lyase